MRLLLFFVQLLVLVAWAEVGHAQGRRVVVAVGSNHGLDSEIPLTYAERDAERFASVMVELGGTATGDVTLVTNPTGAQLMQVLEQIAPRLDKDSMLVVYYSGHGSANAIHLRGGGLSLERLRSAVEAMPAGLRLLVIDACRDAVETKGFRQVKPFDISLSAAPQNRGVVVMHSAGPGEVALESNRLHAGLFSHFLISGLRGAADRDFDGRISVSEAYDFAYGRTLMQSAGSSGRLQHPSIRMDIEGAGPLLLTSVAPTKSLLVLPAGKDVHYIVFEKGSQAAFMEAWSQPARETLVALPAGQFVVQQSADDGYRVSEVTLPFGGSRHLTQGDFTESSREELTQRGGEQVLHANGLSAGLGMTLNDSGIAGEGGTLGYSRGSGAWLWTVGLSVSREKFQTSENDVSRQTLSLLTGVDYQMIGRRLNSRFGLGAAGTFYQQYLDRGRDRDRDQALALGPFARASLSLPLTPQLAWELSLLGILSFYNEDQKPVSNASTHVALESSMLVTTGLAVTF